MLRRSCRPAAALALKQQLVRVLLLVLADDWAERALDILNGRLRVGGIALPARAELVKQDVKQPGNVLDAGSLALDKLRVTVGCGQRRVLEAVIQYRNAVSVVRSGWMLSHSARILLLMSTFSPPMVVDLGERSVSVVRMPLT